MCIDRGLLWFQALIRHALDTINDKLESELGSRCLSVCFRNAQADELQDFNMVVCEDAIEIAMGQYRLILNRRVNLFHDSQIPFDITGPL